LRRVNKIIHSKKKNNLNENVKLNVATIKNEDISIDKALFINFDFFDIIS
jgi:hypothetical protein